MADKKNAKAVVEEIEEMPKTKARSKKRQKASSQIKAKNSSLRQNRRDIMVEIMNISNGRCVYLDVNERPYFDLEMGELEVISLEDLTEVNNRCKGLLRKYKIIITDVMSDEYTIDDVLNYLGVMRYYSNFENRSEDFIEELIFDADYEDFRDAMATNHNLQKAIAGRMIIAYKDEDEREYIDKQKIRLVGKKLGLKDIFEEILLDDLDD